MDKDKLIEKLKEARIKLSQYKEPYNRHIGVGLYDYELDLILTSLTAPVPDGKVTDQDIAVEVTARYLMNLGRNGRWTQPIKQAFIDGALWMQSKLTKTPDAG